MNWHKKLPLTGSVAQRTRASAARQSPTTRVRSRLAIRKPEQAFYHAYSSPLFLNGYKVKTATRYQIAKLFNVGIPTITKWEKLGVLPDPLMYQSRGTFRYPVYLAAQIRCLILVVNDIVKEGGYLSIPWAYLPDHIAMLHEGYAVALRNYHKRAGYFDDDELEDDKPDKFGVSFD